MGSKGSATSTTNQNQAQTYTPNAQAAGYITNALQQGANAAQQPFNIPQAPVAGFSQDQQRAFGLVNQAQGQAQPYYDQAASYFSPQGAQQFANPYIDSVTANLKDIFGQQNSQTTGQLTQAAGGVGADRIAVGQADLAKQQGLAAGQTYSQLYQNAAQQAQAAGYGTANLGQASQNSAFQGASQLLGTGGLQQQLQQAQLNSPYQQQLAQAAFPYQQAQFLASITGALAPGLGGTTSGQSYGTTQSTPAQPSIWSQLLGAGTAAAGLYGGFGGSQSAYNPFGSNASYGGGNMFSGDAYGGSASNPLAGLSASDYAARGGVINPFAEGGGVSDDPIDVSKAFSIPTSQMQPIQTHIPQLNFQQPQAPQQQSGSSGPNLGDIAKIAMMFANRGGVVNPFDSAAGYADGGAPDDDPSPASFDERFPFRMPGTEATNKWRTSVDRDNGDTLPPIITAGTGPKMRSAALPFAPQEDDGAALPENAQPTAGASPFAPQPAAPAPQASDAGQDFAKSPWAALTAAGLGIMGGTSPFAGVNIGQGAQQGLKTLQTQRETAQKDTTIAQAAKRLEQEAKFHEDQFSRETTGQRNQREQADRPYSQLTKAQQETVDRQARQDELSERRLNRPYEEMTAAEKAADERGRMDVWTPAGTIENESGSHPAIMNKNTGQILDATTGKPPVEGDKVQAKGTKAPISDDDAKSTAQRYIDSGNRANLAGLGFSGANRAKVNHYIDVIQKEQGISNQEMATREAEWEGRKTGARTLAVQEARMGSAAFEAEGAIKLARGVIEKLPRTSFLPFNELIQKAQEKTLNPDQAELLTRATAISNTYAAVMSRGASITSDTARRHATELLNTASSPAVFNRVMDTMLNEIDMAKHSPDRMRRFYRQQFGEGAIAPDNGAAPTGGAAPAAAPARTISRQGTVNSGPNAGKKVIEYSDGTREYQ